MKKNLLLEIIGIVLLKISLCACSDLKTDNDIMLEPQPSIPSISNTVEFTQEEKAEANAISDFSIKFLNAVYKDNSENNFVASPANAIILLSMLSNAAEPDIRTEVVNALGCTDMETLNNYCAKALNIFPEADKNTEIAFANSIWYKDIYIIDPFFGKTITDIYSAPYFACDFSQNTLVDEINNWVKVNTRGWIDKIIETIPKETASLLINTLYFKGLWANPFDIEKTIKAEFKGKLGKSTVDMMHNDGLQHYTEGKNYQAVKMEFGEGAFEAILILPAYTIDPAVLLTPETISNITNARYFDRNVDLYYPKFKLNNQPKIDLKSPFQSLGINKIFNKNEYTIFTDVILAENKIFQKAAIEFTETGAEGASVTWNQMAGANLDSPKPQILEMRFNHPFIFLIRHSETGMCLFGGIINKL